MAGKIRIQPPKLLPWLTRIQRSRTLVKLDVEVDRIAERSFRFDFNIIFDHIPIRRGFIQKADYYVGTTGGEFEATFRGGIIREFTGPQTIDVNYTNTSTRKRSSEFELNPHVPEFNKFSWKADAERSFTTQFSGSERTLTPVQLGDTIKWSIRFARGEKAIRDYTLGNLHLFAVCEWPKLPAYGKFRVRPSDVSFFDSKARALSRAKSVAMQYVLWRNEIDILDGQGVEFDFWMTYD